MDKIEEKTVLLDDVEEIFQENPPPYHEQPGPSNTHDVGINLSNSRLEFTTGACKVTGCCTSNDKHCHLVIDQPVSAQISINPPEEYRLHNWLGYAVCVTLCCCLPTGLLAILSAIKANAAASAGEIQKAKSRSILTRNLIIVSLILGLGLWGLCIYSILRFSYELVHNDWKH